MHCQEVAGKLSAQCVSAPVSESPHKQVLLGINGAVVQAASNPNFLLPAELQEHIRLLATVLDPQALSVTALGQDLDTLEMTSESVDTQGPIMSFLAQGGIGLKLISAAQTVYSSRQGDHEIEASIAKVEELGKAFIASGCFFRVNDDSSNSDASINGYSDTINDDAFTSPELSDFCAAVAKTLDLASKMQTKQQQESQEGSNKPRRRLRRKMSQLDCLTRLKDIEKEVWLYAKSSFEKMVQYTVSDVMQLGMWAFKQDGIIKNPADDADGTSGVINLNELEQLVSCESALESELIQSPGAAVWSVRPRMVELTDMAKAVFRALQVALVETCPRVAALHETSVDDADLKQIEALDISQFFDLGLDRSLGNKFVEEVRARMQQIVEKKVRTVLDQMLTLVDTCLAGDGDGLNIGRVAELRKRSDGTAMSDYGTVLSDVVSVGVHDAGLAKGFRMSVAVKMQDAATKAEMGLKQLKDEVGATAVAKVFGADGARLAKVEEFLRRKLSSVTEQISEAMGGPC